MLTISNYHYIRESFSAKHPSIFGVTLDGFKTQLLKLKNTGSFISIEDYMLNQQDILNSKENYLLITFDDGLKEQISNAIPILDELNIPSVFFANSMNYHEKKVSTVHQVHLLRSSVSPNELLKKIEIYYPKIDGLLISEKEKAIACYRFDDAASAILKYILNFSIPFDTANKIVASIFNDYFDSNEVIDSLYMSIDDLKYLGDRKYLGSHSHSHFPLGKLNKDEILFELEFSKKYLEEVTISKIESISYPYGTSEACTQEVLNIAAKAGYSCGFSTTKGINDSNANKLLLNRFDCNDLVGGKNYKL
jgi:peptidoglycan/xylan/chitin deacetylase (PgdA/CDA1 family)